MATLSVGNLILSAGVSPDTADAPPQDDGIGLGWPRQPADGSGGGLGWPAPPADGDGHGVGWP